MGMRALLLLLVVTPTIFAAPSSLCPAMCKCTNSGINVEARCNSLNFAKKSLLREQLKLLTILDVSDAALTKVNVNLNIFPNLKRVNFSSNSIKDISSTILPESLEVIDLSHNSMTYLPFNLHALPNLKEVFLGDNPLYCDCDAVSVMDDLLKNDVVVHPPECAYPKEYAGKMLQSIVCTENLFNGIQGHPSYEGSGSDEIKSNSEEEVKHNSEEEIEHEFIHPGVDFDATTPSVQIGEEGSGDGSEDASPATEVYNDVTDSVIEPLIVPVNKSVLHSVYVQPCNFDCSTPAPLDNANETGELPAPNLFDGIRMLANDLGIIDDPNNESLSQSQSSTVTVEVTPEPMNATIDFEVMDGGLKNKDELSNISVSPDKESNTSYIFLGLFLAAILCLVVYVMHKKRSAAAARRNTDAVNQIEDNKNEQLEEVELLNKPAADAGKPNGTPESIPLINGNKENKKNDEDPIKTLIVEPEEKNEEEVELRHPTDNNLLTPEAKRVTIKAGEIPNSTPKTPVLVTRHLNSDGSIVTTPNIDQRV